MNENIHEMVTRSKSKQNEQEIFYDIQEGPSDDDMDEYGNLKGFIDYDCKEDFDQDEFRKELYSISRGSSNYELNMSPKKNKRKKKTRSDKGPKKNKKIIN